MFILTDYNDSYRNLLSVFIETSGGDFALHRSESLEIRTSFLPLTALVKHSCHKSMMEIQVLKKNYHKFLQ